MRRVLWSALILTLCPVIAAQEDTAASQAAAKAELQELERRYKEAYDEWFKAYRAASEAEDDKKVEELLAKMPAADFLEEFMAGGRKYAGTEGAVPFLSWVVMYDGSGRLSKDAFQTLIRDHVESAELEPLVGGIPYFDPENADEILTRLVDKSPHVQVRVQALFTRANTRMQNEATEAEREEAEADLRRVIELTDDARMKTRAEGAIFEMRNLAVGLVAPEIEAEDLDGVTFKLSDYRGKVVMLDFWGDW